MENGEYDFDGTKDRKEEPVPPLQARAKTIKTEFAESESLRYKLDNKEEDIKELKKHLRIKQEELSEQQVRVSKIDRKLEMASKEGDDRVDKIQRKLDEADMQLKKKEKEYEDIYDALQADIDTLENEKSELKERLKSLSKKSLFEGLTRQSNQPGSPSGSLLSSGSVKDSPMLMQQISSLREALRASEANSTRLQASHMKQQLDALPPLNVPQKPASEKDGGNMRKLSNDTNQLLNELYHLSACPRVVDISKRSGEPVTDSNSSRHQLLQRTAGMVSLQRRATELQVAVTTLLAASRTGGQIRTDFSAFPTPAYAKVLHEKQVETQCIGQVSIPTAPKQQSISIPIHVNTRQLSNIHTRFLN